MAIVYIKALKQELEDTKAKLKAAESKSCNESPAQAPVPASGTESNSLQISDAQVEKQDTMSGVPAADTNPGSK